jgi:hypothetical protein
VFTSSSYLTQAVRNRGSSWSLAGALTVVTLAAGMIFAAGSAHAETAGCGSGVLSTPFSQWGDTNLYTLLPGGSFESGSPAWTLSRGANVAAGSEPYAVTGSLGSSSLSIPPGGSARSPFVCVTPADRTFRFFQRGETAGATLVVSVVYQTLLGNVEVLDGAIAPPRSWSPSPIFHTHVALASAISGETVHLAVRFTSLLGTSRVDDVFLDPRHH